MFRIRIVCLALCGLCVSSLCFPAQAAEVECDATYCFTPQDFGEESLEGICITGLPEPDAGTVLLGSRVLRRGDILAASALEEMTFLPLRTQEDIQAQVCYLPIYPDRVEGETVMTLSILGKEDKAPVAEDSTLETYKNLANEGKLKVTDPEGQTMTYSLQRSPKRGQVQLRSDGTFIYTPKKNKVGVDSFTYTATDPAGNVSREARVTVQILKPTDSRQYTDTAGRACRFEAEWLRNSGLFAGETLGGASCFQPDKPVSRGEFLAMTVKLLDMPMEAGDYDALPANTPQWLRPYLAAALRAGLTEGVPEQGSFEEAVTGAEAAVMLKNALELPASDGCIQTLAGREDVHWGELALAVLGENGLALQPEAALTRGQVAELLYRAYQLKM